MGKCRASQTFTIATCVSTDSDQPRRYSLHLQTRPQKQDDNRNSGHYPGTLRRGIDGVTAVYLEARFYLYGRNFGGSETPPKPQTLLTASFDNYQNINHPKAGGTLLASPPQGNNSTNVPPGHRRKSLKPSYTLQCLQSSQVLSVLHT